MSEFDIEKVQRDLAKARTAEAAVHDLRVRLRRRTQTTSRRRQLQLVAARQQIDDAQRALRSHLGRLAWADLPQEAESELRALSTALQRHRRAIKKMQRLDD